MQRRIKSTFCSEIEVGMKNYSFIIIKRKDLMFIKILKYDKIY